MIRLLSTKRVSSLRDTTLVSHLGRLFGYLSSRRKKQLVALTALMVFTSLTEVLSIGAVIPFLGVLTSPELLISHDLAQPFIRVMKVRSTQDLLVAFTVLFIVISILAGLARITLLWFQTHLSMAIGVELSAELYEKTLYQPYSIHISRNSSEILAGTHKAEVLGHSVIQPVLTAISSLVILSAITIALLVIQPVIATTALLGFSLVYYVLWKITKFSVAENSHIIATNQDRLTKAIQEGLGAIRDLIIDGTQPIYSKIYRDALMPMHMALARNQVIAITPRFGVETLGVVLIVSLAYFFSTEPNGSVNGLNVIPALGAFALGAQRLLPAMQQIYNAYVTIRGNQASTEDVLDLLNQSTSVQATPCVRQPVYFLNSITLKDVSFRYTPQAPWVIKDLNLKIIKGSRVGFVGVTGSGKSTLLDILMGLLEPTGGELLVDNIAVRHHNIRAWQAKISHVPQSIYLTDSSIVENIALGVPEALIDFPRVKRAAEQAQIARVIEDLRDGYNTLIGERGVQLSGGQRQRIGIARALYKRAQVIIFDEATSALDNETEAAVMEAIENLGRDITVLIIAHRISTLRNCDQLVKFFNGSVSIEDGLR